MNLKILTKKYISLIVIIIVITIIIVVLFNNFRHSKQSSNKYESNNKYNSNFSIYDINSSETALYNKYISDEAYELLINQKINIEIKSLEKIDELDKSTATSQMNEYVFLLKDYDNNYWITFSKKDLHDNSYNIQIKNNLICYGKYLGIIEYNNAQYPQVDISYIYKDINKINQQDYIALGDEYINKLNSLYNKENFTFKEFKLNTGYNELIYANKDNSLEICIIIDDMQIKMTSLDINTSKVSLDTIDQIFLHKFISCFDSIITAPDAYLSGARSKKHELEQNIYNKDYKYIPFELNGIIVDFSTTNSSITLYYI